MRVRPRVLLVEPDPDLRRVLQALLAEEAFEVVACSSLVDVLARTEGLPHEVAVVDVWCGGDRALEQYEQRRLRSLARLVPLVVITDDAWASTASSEDLGVIAILPKPFALEAIVSALDAAAWARPEAAPA